jgi:hypothetical protein
LKRTFNNKASKEEQRITILHIKIDNAKMLIIVIYVDVVIFGSNIDEMSQKFVEEMEKEFDMSMLGELSFFLGL